MRNAHEGTLGQPDSGGKGMEGRSKRGCGDKASATGLARTRGGRLRVGPVHALSVLKTSEKSIISSEFIGTFTRS